MIQACHVSIIEDSANFYSVTSSTIVYFQM